MCASVQLWQASQILPCLVLAPLPNNHCPRCSSLGQADIVQMTSALQPSEQLAERLQLACASEGNQHACQ